MRYVCGVVMYTCASPHMAGLPECVQVSTRTALTNTRPRVADQEGVRAEGRVTLLTRAAALAVGRLAHVGLSAGPSIAGRAREQKTRAFSAQTGGGLCAKSHGMVRLQAAKETGATTSMGRTPCTAAAMTMAGRLAEV